MEANKDLLPRRADGRRGHLRRLPERRHDGPGLHRPATSTPSTCSRPRSSTRSRRPRASRRASTASGTGTTSASTATRARPAATRPCATRSSAAALEYAVDREKIVANAYSGHAMTRLHLPAAGHLERPGLRLGAGRHPRRELRPSTGESQMLDDGRLRRLGRRRRARVQGRADHAAPVGRPASRPRRQRACKLIAGWWQAVGIDVELQRAGRGRLLRQHLGLQGRHVRTPTSTPTTGSWDGYFDPGQIAHVLHDRRRSRAGTSSHGPTPSTVSLDALQAAEMDADKRAEYIHQMQQVMYEDAPCFTTVHPVQAAGLPHDRRGTAGSAAATGARTGRSSPSSARRCRGPYVNLTPKVASCAKGSDCFPRFMWHPGTNESPWDAVRGEPRTQSIVVGGPEGALLRLRVVD